MGKYYSNINELNDMTKQDLKYVLMAAYQKGYCDHERGVPLNLFDNVNDIDKLAQRMLNKCRVYTTCYNSLKTNERQYFLKKHKDKLRYRRNGDD